MALEHLTSPTPPVEDVNLDGMNETQVRALVATLLDRVKVANQKHSQQQEELKARQLKIDALTHEIRLLKHWKFAAKTEAMDGVQAKLFSEACDEDLAAAEQQVKALLASKEQASPSVKERPARRALPAHLPRKDIYHEPAQTQCACGKPMRRLSEDVSERLDYTPGTFQVERHIRGVWSCQCCQRLVQEAREPQIIESGIPTSNLLAQVLIAKYADHLPLYRQEQIYARQDVPIAASTLSDWVGACGVALMPLVQALKAQLLQSHVLHADETPIKILDKTGSKKSGYVWAYANASPREQTQDGIVIYEIQSSRSGEHPRAFLSHPPPPPRWQVEPNDSGPDISVEVFDPHWRGSLMVDDYAGYKALFNARDAHGQPYVWELGCWAHARRKFHELHIANQSTLAAHALALIGQLYEVEHTIAQDQLSLAQTLERRQQQSQPIAQALHQWLHASAAKVSANSATAKALSYTLKRWQALTRYLDDATLPIDNNRAENQIRPIALGRKNWLFAGSLAAAQRAAAIMTLIQTAKINQIDPWRYLSDVLSRLPTHPASRINELLPTRSGWLAVQPQRAAHHPSPAIPAQSPSCAPDTPTVKPISTNPYQQLMG